MLENVKRQLNVIGFAALIFAAAFAAIIASADPMKASWIVIVLAYCCVAGFVYCLMTLVFYAVRPKGQGELHYQRLSEANREAFLAAVFVIASLFLSSRGLLYWWVEATLFCALVCFELFFLI